MVIRNENNINFIPLNILDDKPPEIIIDGIDSNFRINQIIRYNDYLITESQKREALTNFYENISMICIILEIVLTISTVSLNSVGQIHQEYLSIISIISIGLTCAITVIKGINYKISYLVDKNRTIMILTKSKFDNVKHKYDNALKDGDISQDEFLDIVNQYRLYEKFRNDILLK